MNKISIYLIITGCAVSTLFSCEQTNILVNANDTSYIIFEKDMTTDSTATSFTFYDEGEDAKVDLAVQIYGKIADADTKFTVSVDKDRTTVADGRYELPTECVIKAGELEGIVTVALKNYPELKTTTKVLAVKIDGGEGAKPGSFRHSIALIAVTDRLLKPDWWSVNDWGTSDFFSNTIEEFYLGEYSEEKYEMFLNELKADDVVFDGKDMQVMRKYALRLKNTLKRLKEAGQTAYDGNGNEITVRVPG